MLTGTQYWFRDNLNAGTRINPSTFQANNGIWEKFCYNNPESNRDIYGGLYNWDEVMNYSTTKGSQQPFQGLTEFSMYWASTQTDSNFSYLRIMYCDTTEVVRDAMGYHPDGMSVRCLKD